MTEISIWNYGDFTQEIIDEFEEMYANHILDFTEICGTFPSGVEFFVQASDAWFEENNIYFLGSFYKAYIKLDGKLYYVSVTGGDQPLIYGEQVVSTLAIDKTLQEELIENEKDQEFDILIFCATFVNCSGMYVLDCSNVRLQSSSLLNLLSYTLRYEQLYLVSDHLQQPMLFFQRLAISPLLFVHSQ